MATLEGQQVKDSYKDLLQVSNSNAGVDATLRHVEDGEGTESALKISTSAVTVSGDSGLTVTGPLEVSGTAQFHAGLDIKGAARTADLTVSGKFIVTTAASPELQGTGLFLGKAEVTANFTIRRQNQLGAFFIAGGNSGASLGNFVMNGNRDLSYSLRIRNDAAVIMEIDVSASTPALNIGSDSAVTIPVGLEVSGTAQFHQSVSIYQDNANTNGMLVLSQDGTGDAVLQYNLVGATNWVMGVDNADGNAFKLNVGSSLDDTGITIGTNSVVTLRTIEVSGTAVFHQRTGFNASAAAAGTPGNFSADGYITILVSGAVKYLPYSDSTW